MFGLIEAKKQQKKQQTPEPRELVVKLDDGLCFDEFGRAVTSLLEDLLYRTSHIDQPVRRLDIIRGKLTPRNRTQLERLEKVLESIARLASSGSLAEVVLVQGSTISLAQYVTHIRLQTARWNDNTNRHENALKSSMLNLFRAVASVDDVLAPTNGTRSAKCFLFVNVVPESADQTPIEGFEVRPTLPHSRAKCRTIFNLRQTNADPERMADLNDESASTKRTTQGIWYQLAEHVPTVSISS